jgi:hypothetical protein
VRAEKNFIMRAAMAGLKIASPFVTATMARTTWAFFGFLAIASLTNYINIRFSFKKRT